jgi:hypothetical protein
MIYFVIAIIFFIIGRYAFPYSSRVVVKNYDNMPGYRTAPPPPPPRKLLNIRKGHMKPVYYGYTGGFSATNQCSNCGIIGLYEDMHTIKPCRDCGGKVKSYGAAKWMMVDGWLQWVPSQVNNV